MASILIFPSCERRFEIHYKFMINLQLLANLIHKHNSDHLYIGFSGGIDSTVLLHLYALYHYHSLMDNHLIPQQSLQSQQSRHPLQLKAIHVNHGLNPKAEEWEAHCKDVCRQLNIELIVHKVLNKPIVGQSVEEFAREERYKGFAQILKSNDVLLLAHNQDDQAETVLLQLLRGAGPKGLSAMGECKSLGKAHIYRPFLSITREQITGHAKENQLKWIEDDSNLNDRFSRNYLRQHIFPLLKSKFPAVNDCFARAAQLCAESDFANQYFIEKYLNLNEMGNTSPLSIAQLRQFPGQVQSLILRNWLNQQNLKSPSQIKLHEILRQMLQAKEDSQPFIEWEGGGVRRYRDHIYPINIQNQLPQLIDIEDLESLSQYGICNGKVKQAIASKKSELYIRPPFPGEKCKLSKRQGTKPLTKWFQEFGVPPWERQNWPLLCIENEIISAINLWVCDGWEVV